MEELKLNNINKGIKLTRKALSNFQSDIVNLEHALTDSRSNETVELDALEELKTIREALERYGEEKVNNSIKNYCAYFDKDFNPRVNFFDVLNSSAGIDGWMRYNKEPL